MAETMVSMRRRRLVQSMAAAPLGGAAGQLFAAPAARGTKLLVVFLRGGYDCASLLVPYASPFYYEARPKIAIARPGEAEGALRLDARWGLHPALAASVMPLYTSGQAAFLPFAGTHDLSRSHFETQDSVELGQPPDRHRDYGSGFLNRLAGVLTRGGAAPQTMAFTDQMPLVLRGAAITANMALGRSGRGGVDARQSEVIASMYQGTDLARPVADGFALRGEVARAAEKDMAAEMVAANRGAISAKGFEAVARRMARLMRERFDIGFVDVGGWDTHVGQGASSGALARRLEEFGRGMAAFAEESGDPGWRRSVIVVVSEFGRTFRENGNGGTDHGHGTVYWLLGGGLAATAGGHVVGEQIEVSRSTLFQDRDFPVLNEYRSVLGGLFQRLYGLSATQLGQVFEGVAPRDLKII